MSTVTTPTKRAWYNKFDSKRILTDAAVDSITLLYYLYSKNTSQGIRDYVINKLYDLDTFAIDTILFQLCHLICIWPAHQSQQLSDLLIYHCTYSVDLTLKSTWILTAMQYHTAERNNLPQRADRISTLIEKIEMAVVNSNNTNHVRPRNDSKASIRSDDGSCSKPSVLPSTHSDNNLHKPPLADSAATPIKRAFSSNNLRQRSHTKTVYHMRRSPGSVNSSGANSPNDSPNGSRVHSPSNRLPLHPHTQRLRHRSHQSPHSSTRTYSSTSNIGTNGQADMPAQVFGDRQTSEPTKVSPHKQQLLITSRRASRSNSNADDSSQMENDIITPMTSIQITDAPGTIGGSSDGTAEATALLLESSELVTVLSKHIRKDYLHLILAMVTNLIKVSLILVRYQIDDRRLHLRKYIRTLDEKCVRGLYFPSSNDTAHYKLVRLLPDDCHALNSRDKAPFLMFCEVVHTNMSVYDPSTFTAYKSYEDAMQAMINDGIVENELETMNIETMDSTTDNAAPYILQHYNSTNSDNHAKVTTQNLYPPSTMMLQQRQVSTQQVQQAVIAAVNKQNDLQQTQPSTKTHTMMHSDSVPVKLSDHLTMRASSDNRDIITETKNHVRRKSVDGGLNDGIHGHHNTDVVDLLQQGLDLASVRKPNFAALLADDAPQPQSKLVHSNTDSKLYAAAISSTTPRHADRINGFGSDSVQVSSDSPTNGRQAPGSAVVSPKSAGIAQQWLPANYSSHAAFGESWQSRKQRIAAVSPYSTLPGWDIKSVIFKAGDDCRQEVLAMQLIQCCHNILLAAKLPLYLRPYSVLITSANSGIIETIPDAISIDSLKKNVSKYNLAAGKAVGWTGLSDFFIAHFLNSTDGSVNIYEDAIRAYVESMAGYSLIQYILNVKDRHNGNILLDRDGHIVHIDYGFMLCNSPGNNWGFESCPFKLTAELLDVMGGESTELFNYFKILFIRGFLELRQHAHQLITMVDCMTEHSNMACFGPVPYAGSNAGGADGVHPATQQLIDRFVLSHTDEAAVEYAVSLIDASMLNWRTVQYDNYQRLTNNIE